MNSLLYPFEELPDFRDGEFRSGSHNGCAEICYSDTGEWTIRAISLDCHNGKIGETAKAKSIPLSRAFQGALWEALSESLDAFARAHIEEAIDRALAADGVSIAPPQAEHRLRSWELV